MHPRYIAYGAIATGTGRPARTGRKQQGRGRGGVGLGLAIVRSIVVAHDGTIRIRPRAGGGLELEIGLPGGPSSSYAASPPGLS
jgi:K+-sensing histidine kinase KdpD